MRPKEFDYECTIELDVRLRVAVHPGERQALNPIERAHPGSAPEVEVIGVFLGDLDITSKLTDSELEQFTKPTPSGRTWENEYHRILECAEEIGQGDW